MKIKIKLRDLTPEQWDKNRDSLCKLDTLNKCDNCIFKEVNCSESFFRNSWIHHKDSYSDKFLDQKVEIEIPDILNEKEKKYLSNIIKPFRNKVTSIKKLPAFGSNYRATYCILITINSQFGIFGNENIQLPYFQNDMYKGMEAGKNYTLEELDL